MGSATLFHRVDLGGLERSLETLGLKGDVVAYKYLTSDYFLSWDTTELQPYFETRLPLLEEALGLRPAPHWLPTDWVWLRRKARSRALSLLRAFSHPRAAIANLLALGSASNLIRQPRRRRRVPPMG